MLQVSGESICASRLGPSGALPRVGLKDTRIRDGNLLETITDVRAKSDRPLDCWKEVEAFKNEVNKLESVSWLAVPSSGS